MKVRELNALLQKLAKSNPDADISMGFSTLIGPQFDDPAVVQASDGVYIVPQNLANGLKDSDTEETIGQAVQRVHQEWSQNQQSDQSGA